MVSARGRGPIARGSEMWDIVQQQQPVLHSILMTTDDEESRRGEWHSPGSPGNPYCDPGDLCSKNRSIPTQGISVQWDLGCVSRTPIEKTDRSNSF